MTDQPAFTTDPAIREAHGPVELTSQIVVAYVSHNSASAADLPKLIEDVYGALMHLDTVDVAVSEPQKPSVSIRKSVTPERLICLEDGLAFKSLKRHLTTSHQLTPDQYRQKWALPEDYPMVAPDYSATRSALAISRGLGRKAGWLSPKRLAKLKI